MARLIRLGLGAVCAIVCAAANKVANAAATVFMVCFS